MGRVHFQIVRAKAADAATLTQLQRACLPGDAPLSAARGLWWIAYDDQAQPVGFACLLPTRGDIRTGYLARTGVIHRARGNGLQRRMIRVREQAARKLGMTAIVTDTHRENHASSNSLMAMGYRLYTPQTRWAFNDGLYWRKTL
jgi:GNAT superfamily N-acetyltransferase